MLNTTVYHVRILVSANRSNEFEAYFIDNPEAADVISAIQDEQKRLRFGAENSDDFIDTEVNEERAAAMDVLIELVNLAKSVATQNISVAGTTVGRMDVKRIPALARDPNRTLQELIA